MAKLPPEEIKNRLGGVSGWHLIDERDRDEVAAAGAQLCETADDMVPRRVADSLGPCGSG